MAMPLSYSEPTPTATVRRWARIVDTYTCPRCRAYNRRAVCRRCGWTPVSRTRKIGPEAACEDRMLGC